MKSPGATSVRHGLPSGVMPLVVSSAEATGVMNAQSAVPTKSLFHAKTARTSASHTALSALRRARPCDASAVERIAGTDVAGGMLLNAGGATHCCAMDARIATIAQRKAKLRKTMSEVPLVDVS